MQISSKRKVKVVCTLGPASSSPEKIRDLISSGMNVARLNFSHGSHDFHRNLIKTIRTTSDTLGMPVAIMQDLQGPKLRAGMLPKEGIQLSAGDVLLLYPEGSAIKSSTNGKKTIPISAEIAQAISQDVKPGARILFDDGKLWTEVKSVNPPEIVVEVSIGGILTSHKGMNLPGTPLSMPCLTEKDLQDLKFGLAEQVDAIALSFVRRVEDVEDLKDRILQGSNENPLVISKIEREEGIFNSDGIIEVSDGLLIARGDMAVEIGAEKVPTVQKHLIHSCNELGVPVITATQMLESMISSPTPTRAEASDVANAVFDGTDAVMLSGETASGQYPIHAVQTMVRIILEAEKNTDLHSRHTSLFPVPGSVVDAIEYSAAEIARTVGAVGIGCLTHTGMAARTLAKFRPSTPILAMTNSDQNVRRLSFVWGVMPFKIPEIAPTDDVFKQIEKIFMGLKLADTNDLIVITAGIPTLRRGTTNMVKVHRINVSQDRARA